MRKRNTEGLGKYAKSKNMETINNVNAVIDKLKRSRTNNINFSTVAKEAGVSKATLYNNDILKERILSLRTTTKGIPNTKYSSKTIDRTDSKGYLNEIRKLREDKKNLILQLIEMDTLRDENARIKLQLYRQRECDL